MDAGGVPLVFGLGLAVGIADGDDGVGHHLGGKVEGGLHGSHGVGEGIAGCPAGT